MLDRFCNRVCRVTFHLLTAGILGLCGTSAAAQSYLIGTLAGVPGASGTNDGISTYARFNYPTGIAVDNAGALYVADSQSHVVRKLTRSPGTDWTVTTLAGLPGVFGSTDGTNSDARFNLPTGIAVDQEGKIFVSERYNHTIREIRSIGTNWVVTTVAGLATVTGHDDGTNADARFYLPSGIAVDSSDNLFVADAANFTIRQISPVGTNWVVATIAGFALDPDFVDAIGNGARFNFPYDVALSDSGKLYVADWGNNAIRELSRSGPGWMVKTIAGSGDIGSDDGLGSSATFDNPTGVCVDSAGIVYVADQSNDTIRKLVPGSRWSVTTLAGAAGAQGSIDAVGTNALFRHPWGIAADTNGTLFITDWANSTIRSARPFVSPMPVPQITYNNRNEVILTWPAALTGYQLVSSAQLGPGASWVPISAGATKIGDQMVVTNRMAAAGAFYRLEMLTEAP
ncbi:MAG TPA: hypothetical protein VHI52_01480 [Verrucomicrobiae bacterium]|nr:hypothetical protein [Verrucomicrobiae bacterium]